VQWGFPPFVYFSFFYKIRILNINMFYPIKKKKAGPNSLGGQLELFEDLSGVFP
jgi:hypothetical protein